MFNWLNKKEKTIEPTAREVIGMGQKALQIRTNIDHDPYYVAARQRVLNTIYRVWEPIVIDIDGEEVEGTQILEFVNNPHRYFSGKDILQQYAKQYSGHGFVVMPRIVIKRVPMISVFDSSSVVDVRFREGVPVLVVVDIEGNYRNFVIDQDCFFSVAQWAIDGLHNSSFSPQKLTDRIRNSIVVRDQADSFLTTRLVNEKVGRVAVTGVEMNDKQNVNELKTQIDLDPGNIAISGPAEITRLDNAGDYTSITNAQEYASATISNAVGVPDALLRLPAQLSENTFQLIMREYYTSTIEPILDSYDDVMNKHILPQFGLARDGISLSHRSIMPTDREMESRLALDAWRDGVYNKAQVLEALGKEPQDGDENIYNDGRSEFGI